MSRRLNVCSPKSRDERTAGSASSTGTKDLLNHIVQNGASGTDETDRSQCRRNYNSTRCHDRLCRDRETFTTNNMLFHYWHDNSG